MVGFYIELSLDYTQNNVPKKLQNGEKQPQSKGRYFSGSQTYIYGRLLPEIL